jgi:L-threonylcarbamoyladenylate synthase
VVRAFRFGDPVAPLRDLLARGGIVAFPTESSYALGVDPWNRTGVEAIYRIKEREAGKALPVVIAGSEQLAGLGIDPDLHIVERFFAVWPAPLTVVLPVARPLPASAGEGTLAVRVPAHQELRALLAALGHGLTATSANRSGEAPILDPAALGALLAGADAAVVDGGVLPGGLPSTLVALSAGGAIEGEGLVVLREGRFPAERLAQDLGRSTARGEAPPARPTGEDEA